MTVTRGGPVSAPAAGAGFRPRALLRAAVSWLARWRRTSAAKAAGAPIGRAERALTAACDLAGSLVVATGAALYCQDAAEPGRPWSRLGWEEVGGVFWDDRRCVLTLTGVRPGGIWRKELALPSPAALVELARERVSWTQLASTTVRLDDRVCAVVAARRQPPSGKVIWTVVLDGASDTGDPAIGAMVQAAIADLQAQTGIPAAGTADAGGPW